MKFLFKNFDFIVVYQLDLGTVYRLSLCIGFLIFFLNCSFVIAIVYGRTLVGKDINTNKGRDFTGADVMTAAFCTLMGIMGIGLTAPNLKIVQESCKV